MRKHFSIVALAAVIATAVALSVGVGVASASICGGNLAGGLQEDSSWLGTSSAITGTIDMVKTSYQNGDHRSFLGVSDPNNGTSVYVGLIRDVHGIEIYTEKNGTFSNKVSAAKDTVYNISLNQGSNGFYTASYTLGGNTFSVSGTVNDSGARTLWAQAVDNQNPSSTCNTMQYNWGSHSGARGFTNWTPTHAGPYNFVGSITDNAFAYGN